MTPKPRPFLIILLGLALLPLTPTPAIAVPSTFYVGPTGGQIGNGTSCASPGFIGEAGITSAITATTSGDTVILCNGTYYMSSRITISKGITLKGELTQPNITRTVGSNLYPRNVILDGSGSTTGILKIASQGSVTIKQLTFYKANNRNVDGLGGGAILVSILAADLSTSPQTQHVIEENKFIQGFVSGNHGAGINVRGASAAPNINWEVLRISKNDFIENSAMDGAAVDVVFATNSPESIRIDSNRFLYNKASRSGGALQAVFANASSSNNYYYQNLTTNLNKQAFTLRGNIKFLGGDILMNDTTYRDCVIPATIQTDAGKLQTKTDNRCLNLINEPAGNQVDGFTYITRSEGLLLTQTFPPQSPKIASIETTGSKVFLNLGTSNSGGSSITQYEYSTNGIDFRTVPSGLNNPLIICSLNPSTNYTGYLRAISQVGTSVSTTFEFRTQVFTSPESSEGCKSAEEIAAEKAAAEAARVAAAAQKQKELTEILSIIPAIAGLALNLAVMTNALLGPKKSSTPKQKCVKGSSTKYVKKGGKCLTGYTKKK